MRWEELTAPQFEAAAAECGVCVLPIGVLEKHGNHLPLGTDMYTSSILCAAAAQAEPAIVFPYYFFGQIAEARHYPGTISVSHNLIMRNLLAMCDEIRRNGINKILILSGHGGNRHFLPFFVEEMPRLARDYQVYTGSAVDLTSEQQKEIAAMVQQDDMGQHAGLMETALMYYLRGGLINMAHQDPVEGQDRKRLEKVKEEGLFTGFNWYASFPYHYAGDHSKATAEMGKRIFDMMVGNIKAKIKAVKDDDESLALVKEYAGHTAAPTCNKITQWR